MRRFHPGPIQAATAAALTIPLLLVGCGKTEEPAATPTPTSSSTAAPTTTTSSTTAPSTTSQTSASASASTAPTTAEATPAPATTTPATTTPADAKATTSSTTSSDTPTTTAPAVKAAVADTYETFKSLAPQELFSKFESCSETAVKDSFECSGPEVGQVQFFKSDSKATQTTQVLTELRSSRVLEDNGDRIIGWSTLGTTAILTVVDNSQGLVLQQMISTDLVDPEHKLKELGFLQG